MKKPRLTGLDRLRLEEIDEDRPLKRTILGPLTDFQGRMTDQTGNARSALGAMAIFRGPTRSQWPRLPRARSICAPATC